MENWNLEDGLPGFAPSKPLRVRQSDPSELQNSVWLPTVALRVSTTLPARFTRAFAPQRLLRPPAVSLSSNPVPT